MVLECLVLILFEDIFNFVFLWFSYKIIFFVDLCKSLVFVIGIKVKYILILEVK